MDWLLTPAGQIDESQELASSIVVALGTDRLADTSDVLPDLDSEDRRGWWGDTESAEIWDGWPIGTRLWLLSRAKILGAAAREGSTLARAENYVHEALRPFKDRRIASRIDVNVERADLGRIDVSVTLYRGPLPAIELRFQSLWKDMGG